MIVLYIILGVILGLVALFFILALFVKKEYFIERSIVINKPKKDVFEYIKHLKNQDHYNKWVMQDPAMKKDFRGMDGTVGFVYIWDGNRDAGAGELEIKKITEGERLDMEIRFARPMVGVSQAHKVTTAISANQTKFSWGMQGRTPYPMNFTNLFVLKILGKDLDTSLGRLKEILERQN